MILIEVSVLEHIRISLNILIPMIFLVVLGYFLRKYKVINDAYENISSKIVFNIALPVTLFSTTASAKIDIKEIIKLWPFLLLITIIFIIIVLITYFISTIMTIEKKTKGAFIQGGFRSNYVIIGYPILLNIFGDTIILHMTLTTVFMIPIFNILSVIILTINNPDIDEYDVKSIVLNILKNPLIIGIMLGLFFSVLNIGLPQIIINTTSMIGGLTTPLALINIGSMYTFSLKLKNRTPQLVCLMLKTIIYPFIFTSISALLGFKGLPLAVLFVALAAPSPPSSYVMAKIMNSDEIFAANNVVLTTSVSAITIFTGIILLNHFGLI